MAPLSVHGAMVFGEDEVTCVNATECTYDKDEVLQKELESLKKSGNLEVRSKKPVLLKRVIRDWRRGLRN